MTPQQKSVDAWNGRHETVVPVTYRKDDKSTVDTATRSKAFVLGGHTATIMVDGVCGCVALDRVTVRR